MSIRMGRARKNRPELLPNPSPVYGYGKYPDRVRVSFANGRTKVYETPIEQPKPVFFTKEELKRMSRTPGSYKFGEGVRK